MRIRKDLSFFFVTKRPERFYTALPADWGDGYENVSISCTCENQQMADKRLPVFLELPIRHRHITHEPMLEDIDLTAHLERYAPLVESVTCGGESGDNARVCLYEWILHTREQCIRYGVPFHFKQTGARFIKDGRLYRVPRPQQQRQAGKPHCAARIPAEFLDFLRIRKSKAENQSRPEASGAWLWFLFGYFGCLWLYQYRRTQQWGRCRFLCFCSSPVERVVQ